MPEAFFILDMQNITTSDLRSTTWKHLVKDLEERLQDLREMNDVPEKTELQTALIRGQIKEVKRLLALSQDSARAEDFPGNGEVDPSQ